MNTSQGYRPWLVGTVRGIATAVVATVLALVVQEVGATDVPDDVQQWAPIIIVCVRSIEGWLDDKGGNQPRQQKRLGGGPVE